MPTAKRRLNITLPKDVSLFLQQIAIRDDMPEATKARELLEHALALEEDAWFSAQAEHRDSKTRRWMGHDAFWSSLV
jgi:hypothetical protein